MTDCLIVIPARLKATRLPGKPLVEIAGEPMIVHVWRRAVEADCGPVVVATDAEAVRDAVLLAGGKALITREDHASGSDRIFETVETFDPKGTFEVIVNLQGDLPTLDPRLVRAAWPRSATTTAISALSLPSSRGRKSAPTLTWLKSSARRSSRRAACAPLFHTGDRALWRGSALSPHRHLCLSSAALHRFVSLPPSPLELREKLEQLRALEAGMRIHVGLVDTVPLGVDTPADLKRARELLKSRR